MAIESRNPATGEVLRKFEAEDDASIEAKLRKAEEAFQAHRRSSFADRAERMREAAEILEGEKHRWGRLMTQEMGKPLKAAVQEAEKCARGCRYYADNAERFLADEDVPVEGARAYVKYQPIGPVLAIMPWNFPFWQVFRFAAPALMAGNVGLLKHASNVPQCSLAIEEILRRAGFPEGVFQTLLIGPDKVTALIADRRIAAATLTGSDAAGSSVGADAGRKLKKTVLELGGSDPFVVMPSADLKVTVRMAVQARAINNGQSCIAAKRFIVHERIYDEFERRFVDVMQSLVVGDPMDEKTDVGPLATKDILAGLDEQVQETVRKGARLLTGGKRLERPGCYYAPTVLADIPEGSPADQEELFGPVAALFRVHDLEEAIRKANDTPFGLGASAWTNESAERDRLIEGIEAGMVFVNEMVASSPPLPFGGVKRSGYGRELSVFGIREFVNIKAVWIKNATPREKATE